MQVALPLSGALIIGAVISLIKFKYTHYYLPVYPFFALLLGVPFQKWFQIRHKEIRNFVLGAALLTSTVLVCAPISLAPEMFPALKRFNAIIQNQGSFQDRVLLVTGDLPYGGGNDYAAEIRFYTYRRFLAAPCDGAEAKVAETHPEWMILSKSQWKSCLQEATRAKYPYSLTYGSLVLLSSLKKAEFPIDLTPLEQELQVTADGVKLPLRNTPYSKNAQDGF